MYNKVQIGENLERLMLEKGFTQRELAKKLRCSHSTVSYMIHGEFEPNLDRLIHIAKVLETDLYTLAGIDIATFMTVSQAKTYHLVQILMDECQGFSDDEIQRCLQAYREVARDIKREKK